MKVANVRIFFFFFAVDLPVGIVKRLVPSAGFQPRLNSCCYHSPPQPGGGKFFKQSCSWGVGSGASRNTYSLVMQRLYGRTLLFRKQFVFSLCQESHG